MTADFDNLFPALMSRLTGMGAPFFLIMPHPTKIPPPIQLPILADLQSRGDGTFILRPRLVDSDLDTWITPRDAAKLLGLGRQGVYDLCAAEAPYLVARHPALRKILISLKSVQALRRATVNDAFWTSDVTARNTILAQNRAALAAPGN